MLKVGLLRHLHEHDFVSNPLPSCCMSHVCMCATPCRFLIDELLPVELRLASDDLGDAALWQSLVFAEPLLYTICMDSGSAEPRRHKRGSAVGQADPGHEYGRSGSVFESPRCAVSVAAVPCCQLSVHIGHLVLGFWQCFS